MIVLGIFLILLFVASLGWRHGRPAFPETCEHGVVRTGWCLDCEKAGND